MSQTYDDTTPESGVTTFGNLYQIIRDHKETLRSSFSGTVFPTSPSPVAGQVCYRTNLGTNGKWFVYSGNPAVGLSGWVEIAIEGEGIGQEVIDARGSKSDLDGRLDVALNEDGTLKASTSLNPSQWLDPAFTWTYISTTSCKTSGDQTDIYYPTRRIKIDLTGSTEHSEIVSASYGGGETTIVIADAVLDSTIEDSGSGIEHSIIAPLRNDGAVSPQMLNTGRVKSITGNYTQTLNDCIIEAAAPSGGLTITLLAAATMAAGYELKIIKTDATGDEVEIDPNGSETIGGASKFVLTKQYEALHIYCDGSNLKILHHEIRRSFRRGVLSWKAADEIYIEPGCYHLQGTYDWVYWDSQLTVQIESGASSDAWYWVYIDDSAVASNASPVLTASQIILDTVNVPVWNDIKKGYYYGDDLCIGMVRTNQPGDILEFYQDGRQITWVNEILNASNNSVNAPENFADIGAALTVPSIVSRALVHIRYFYTGGSAENLNLYIRPNGASGTTGLNVGRVTSGGEVSDNTTVVFVDSGGLFEIRDGSATATNEYTIKEHGFYLPEGM